MYVVKIYQFGTLMDIIHASSYADAIRRRNDFLESVGFHISWEAKIETT